MKFIKKTFGYMGKNLPVLVLMAAVPAVVLGLLARPSSMIVFLEDYRPETGMRFWDMQRLVTPFANQIWMLLLLPLLFLFGGICTA